MKKKDGRKMLTKKGGIAILMSDKIEFREKGINRDKGSTPL